MRSVKGRIRYWTTVKAGLKDKVLERSVIRLERAKMLLMLARQCYTSYGILSLESKTKALQVSQNQRLQIIEEILCKNNQPSCQVSMATTDHETTKVSSVAWTNR